MEFLATIALTVVVSTAQDFSTVQDMDPNGPMCRANGQWYHQGEIACIQPPCMEPQLSRCGMVLNNSSWQKIEDGCPSAALATEDLPLVKGAACTHRRNVPTE